MSAAEVLTPGRRRRPGVAAAGAAPVLAGLLAGLLVGGGPHASLRADPVAETPPAATQAERDRRFAADRLSEAESHAATGDLADALRAYQRAWRWDPAAVEPLDKIVPLAFRLGRTEEAIRYTLLDLENADADLLRRVAIYLTEQQDWAAALRLYRRWLSKEHPAVAAGDGRGKRSADARRVGRLLGRLEIARLEYLVDEVSSASRSFEAVQSALLATDAGRAVGQRLRVAMNGVDGTTWEVFGRCHLDAGRHDAARIAFEQMRGASDSTTRARYWQAELAAAEGRPLVAYELLKAFFDETGPPADEPPAEALRGAPYALMTRILTGLGDRRGLVSDLKRLAGPGRPHAVAALADAHAAVGEGAVAESLYRRLVLDAVKEPRPPQLTDELVVQAARWLIARFESDGRLVDLLAIARALGGAVPSFDPLNGALDNALADTRQADRLLGGLDRWKPGDRTADELFTGAWIARRADRGELAERLQRAAVTASPAETARGRHLNWALDLLLEDKPRQAAQTLRWGLDRATWDAGEAAPYFYLATAHALADEHESALAAASEAALRDRDSAETAARVAWVLNNAERTDEAVAEYRQVIENFDDDPDAATRESLKDARSTLSYLLLGRGDAAGAAELLEQILDEFPADAGALNDLAYLWADRGEHLERARRMAERAAAAEPDSDAYLDTLAWCQFRLGDARAAHATIRRAVRIAESAGREADGEILDHYGEILASLGRREQAHSVWRRALTQLEESDPERFERVRQKLPPED